MASVKSLKADILSVLPSSETFIVVDPSLMTLERGIPLKEVISVYAKYQNVLIDWQLLFFLVGHLSWLCEVRVSIHACISITCCSLLTKKINGFSIC